MINIERIENQNQTIWRYMDLWKFESMLEDNGCLYFTRSDMFNDKLEGKYSDITLKNLEDKYLKIHGKTFVENWKALYYSKGDYIDAVKRNSLVSCWHISDNENKNMWESYTSKKESIVIKSSIENIYKALKNIPNNNTFNIDIGEVEYVNFHNTILEYKNHILEPLFYKDIEYKYEQELRIIVWKRPENNILNTNLSNFNVCQGGSLNIDLDILIEEIYISPNSSDDFMEKIKQLLPDNLKNKVIKKSVLENETNE